MADKKNYVRTFNTSTGKTRLKKLPPKPPGRSSVTDIKTSPGNVADPLIDNFESNLKKSIPTPSTFRNLGILGLLFILIVIGVIFRMQSDLPNISFSSLLNYLSNISFFELDLSIPLINIGTFPNWLSWLAGIINALATILNFALWIIESLVQILSLILTFLGWLIVP